MFRIKRAVFLAASLLWASGIFLVSSIPASGLPSDMGYWTNIGHFTEYLVLAVLIALTLQKQGRALWKTALLAISIASLYGASDEFHQWFVAGRYTDVFDWLTDTAGAVSGAAIVVLRISMSNKKVQKQEASK
jgi:VanZ family protein